ncbi:hypothetical protein C0J52_23784 [Blattella germanica]|nr:hypothetical protein C0J52_23784 [Blattella germanica]
MILSDITTVRTKARETAFQATMASEITGELRPYSRIRDDASPRYFRLLRQPFKLLYTSRSSNS